TLADIFHQPFDLLPAVCEATDSRVRQVRLCVEALRGLLGARPLAGATREAELAEAERIYRLAVYSSSLARIGTSYAELRLARSAGAPDRQSLADRLGINLDRLDAVYLDPDANPAVLTEPRLEQIFGLVDTTRHPLAASGIPEWQTWRLEHLRTLWRS